MPVSGWTQQLAQTGRDLNLPPGYMLLATTGVDQSPDAWVASWRLLDYFLVLVIAVAVRRLFGNLAGVVALLALAVTFHEPGAPIWSWLNLVVALALAGAVSEGRFAWMVPCLRNASYLLRAGVPGAVRLPTRFDSPCFRNSKRSRWYQCRITEPSVSVGVGMVEMTGDRPREEALMQTSDAVGGDGDRSPNR